MGAAVYGGAFRNPRNRDSAQSQDRPWAGQRGLCHLRRFGSAVPGGAADASATDQSWHVAEACQP